MTELRIGSHEVANYSSGEQLTIDHSPRPYLHPVRTLAGADLTETRPKDHPHHYGVSAAIADINGTTYWGGASYVPGDGYVLLENQGREVGDPASVEPGRIAQHLTWFDHHVSPQLSEDRLITAEALPDDDAWLLRWRSSLHADTTDLVIGSPATRGRTGAGYGGLFWRMSGDTRPTEVRVEEGGGAESALGSLSPWLSLTQHRPLGPVTLLLAQPADGVLPWFVRTEGYVGAGPAVAWAEPHTLAHGETLDLHLWAVLTDRALTRDDARDLYHRLEQTR